jgi:hypothetical protein
MIPRSNRRRSADAHLAAMIVEAHHAVFEEISAEQSSEIAG